MHYGGGGGGGGGGHNADDDDYRRNSLPEWSLDDPATMDITKVGTFDASGAFHEAFDEELGCAEGDKAGDEGGFGGGGRNRKQTTTTTGGAGSRILERATKQQQQQQESSAKSSTASTSSSTASTVRKQSSSSSSNGNEGSSAQQAGSKKDEGAGGKGGNGELSNNHGVQQRQTAADSWNDVGIGKSGSSSAKIDYFNLSDPSLSPSRETPGKQKQSVQQQQDNQGKLLLCGFSFQEVY